jgi:transcription initiation factor TFIIIB Brf1 subunit/transcription initiation factor TFIIB
MQNTSNITEEEYSTSAVTDCNVNANGFISIKMIGKGSYGYQRSLLKTCANYSKYRKINTLKDMNNWNTQSEKHHIPKNVINEANEMFATIKEKAYKEEKDGKDGKKKKKKLVFRKDGKKGVQAACAYYACYKNNISKTPAEIAQFCGIEEKFLSIGMRILGDLGEFKVIDIPVKINPISDYTDRYFELLDIPRTYKPFVMALIQRAESQKIHILHDNKNTTKCVGAIYMLVERTPELRKRITKEKIEQECTISKTTFIRYYTILCQYYRKIKKTMKIYGICMPREWKD